MKEIEQLRKLIESMDYSFKSHPDIRKVTNKLYQMMDDGEIDPRVIADACLLYMSEQDVANMAHENEILLRQDYDDNDDADEDNENEETEEE